MLSKNHARFILNAREKFGWRFDYSRVNYINAKEEVAIVCPEHGVFYQTPERHLKSIYGCPKCADEHTVANIKKTRVKNTEKDVLKKAESKGLKLLSKYVDSKQKYKFKCETCGHVFEGNTCHILSDGRYGGCPKCRKNGKNRRRLIDVINELKLRNPDIELITDDVNLNKVVRIADKFSFKCLRCGHVWKAALNGILGTTKRKPTKCPMCGCSKPGDKPKRNACVSKEEFVERLSERRPTIELIGGYVNMSHKARFKCKECGYEWSTLPKNILRPPGKRNASGCPVCSKTIKKTTKSFKEELSKLKKDITVIGEYKDIKSKIKCKCDICGAEFEKSAECLLIEGTGCPNCKSVTQTSLFEQEIYECFKFILGEDEVQNRTVIDGIGELDVFVPSCNIAVEYGSLHWHNNQLEHDAKKRRSCLEHNIKLLTIYDGENKCNAELECESIFYYKKIWSIKRRLEVLNRILLYFNLGQITKKQYLEINNKARLNMIKDVSIKNGLMNATQKEKDSQLVLDFVC